MTTNSSDSTAHPQQRIVHIPEIAGSLREIFLYRTIIALALVVAGVFCLYFGGQMLATSITAQAQTVLFEIGGKFKLTAGGFGAVVMATSLVPFFLAYLSRPMISLIPTGGGEYRIAVGAERRNVLRWILNALRRLLPDMASRSSSLRHGSLGLR